MFRMRSRFLAQLKQFENCPMELGGSELLSAYVLYWRKSKATTRNGFPRIFGRLKDLQ
jgi:hypothetical protein